MAAKHRSPLVLTPDAAVRAVEPGGGGVSEDEHRPGPPGEASVPLASDASHPTGSDTGRRAAAWAFGAYVVVAFFLLLGYFGRDYWFVSGDWGMLVGRSLYDVDDLFRPQYGHWSTVPVVYFQVLYKLVGLDAFWLYQVGVVGLHLALCVLLRAVMRRAGVRPWLATIAAGSFVLFGVAWENILLPIQVSQMTSIVAGFVMLLLTDHDGRFGRRDALALVAGLVALMASGMGPPMVIVVGIAVLIRRGPLLAAACTAPLAVVYVVWYRAQGVAMSNDFGPPEAGVLRDWVATGETGVFVALGHWRGVGLALGALLVVGMVLLVRDEGFRRLRSVAAVPVALAFGSVVVLAAVGWQRWAFGVGAARESHYLGIAVACTLPLLALAGEAVVRRAGWLLVPVAGLFLVGVPGGIGAFDDAVWDERYYEHQRDLVIGTAYSPLIDDAPLDHHPDASALGADEVTVGFLIRAREDGRLPPPPELTPELEDEIALRLQVAQSRDVPPAAQTCAPQVAAVELPLTTGQLFTVAGPVDLSQQDGDGWSTPVSFDTVWGGGTFRLVGPDQVLRVEPTTDGTPITVCV